MLPKPEDFPDLMARYEGADVDPAHTLSHINDVK